ncbi:MAG: BON domain-containing protein [Pontiellaceae bacterium]|nr:BON domain-containing protein [Pontiellaceae bacterium]
MCITGCDEAPSAAEVGEKTGEALDTAAEKTVDLTGKALNKTGEALQKAGEAVENTGENMQKMDDASITSLVKAALLAQRPSSATKTTIETQDGMVTLTGVANSESEKAMITKLVSEIQGVKNVTNEMTVETE